MTSMPELVAILHSFVGLAAVLVGFATYLGPHTNMTAAEKNLHTAEVFIGVCIGSITFTGSVIAFLKLRGSISGKPLMLPGRHLINIIMLLVTIGLGVAFFMSPDAADRTMAAADRDGRDRHSRRSFHHGDRRCGHAGRRLDAQQLFRLGGVGGGLYARRTICSSSPVRSSDHRGAILSYIMCRGMNRSFVSVMLGGFGTESGTAAAASSATRRAKCVRSTRRPRRRCCSSRRR